mmetsp:Transcript_13235/g.31123  ORF Transcript_13235/g.31123 Transcript_13235/m.31123 type:complete len:98 (+) Transcript_13235:1594-1887(+)
MSPLEKYRYWTSEDEEYITEDVLAVLTKRWEEARCDDFDDDDEHQPRSSSKSDRCVIDAGMPMPPRYHRGGGGSVVGERKQEGVVVGRRYTIRLRDN